MAASLSTVAGKDGAGAAIVGGVQALDLSGAGSGPWSFANIVVDGISGVNRAAVKAASTAPTATDPALVVAISPNSQNANGAATTANSTPVTIASDQATIAVAADTSRIANGATGTNLTPKFAKISVSSSGANQIVAAVTSKKIRVLAWDVVVNAAVNFKWQSHVTPTDLTGLYPMAGQGGGVARSYNPLGYFETVAGEALDLNLSGAVSVGGVLTYVEV